VSAGAAAIWRDAARTSPPTRRQEGGQRPLRGAGAGERLLTLEEVAEFLAVPVRTLYSWRYRGEGPPALKLGGLLRYDPVALRRWLDGLSK